MIEDKVLQKIHQTQARFHQAHKGLSWEQEAKLMSILAKKVAKQYNYPVFPIAKTPGILLQDRSQNYKRVSRIYSQLEINKTARNIRQSIWQKRDAQKVKNT